MQDILQAVSLAASVASLVLAILAIWIALYGKKEADRTHQETQSLLTEIRSDAKSVAQVAMPELRAYGESVREFVFRGSGSPSRSTVSALENSFNASLDRIRGELEELRAESDVRAIREKLLLLEGKIEASGEDLRESVRDAFRISVESATDIYHFEITEWSTFLRYFLRRHKLHRNDYGKSWEFRDEKTRETFPREAVVEPDFDLSNLGSTAVARLRLVKPSGGGNS